METVILAAGEGTRMEPLTEAVPKPMMPVGDRPLVGHVARRAVAAGASRLVVVVPPGDGAITSYFGDSLDGVPVETVEQPVQDGTAGALRVARDVLADGAFAVLNGDVMVDETGLRSLYETVPGVGSYRVDDPTMYGVLEPGKDGTVGGVIEKPESPPSELINAGAYTFPHKELERLDGIGRSDRGEYELTDLLAITCREYDVRAVPFDRWLDVGRPWELLAANEWRLSELEGSIAGEVHPDAVLEGTVVVEAGATVRAGVVIEGPVLIREGATVGPNAYLRGATTVGPGASVGHAVEVKNSVLFSEATVGHQSYVGDSILGPAVNLGAGTNVANLRHDGTPVCTTVRGEVVSTGRRKYGAVLGPGAKTGINTALNPGVVLGAGATTRPGEVVLRSRD